MRNLCEICNGSGVITDSSVPWWKFWVTRHMTCPCTAIETPGGTWYPPPTTDPPDAPPPPSPVEPLANVRLEDLERRVSNIEEEIIERDRIVGVEN